MTREQKALYVLGHLTRAAKTLRMMPSLGGPASHRVQWPQYVRDGWLAYRSEAAEQDLRRTRVQASPEDITHMDLVLPWLQLLTDQAEAKAIWLRANGASWRRCAKPLGKVDARTGKTRTLRALGSLVDAIEREGFRFSP